MWYVLIAFFVLTLLFCCAICYLYRNREKKEEEPKPAKKVTPVYVPQPVVPVQKQIEVEIDGDFDDERVSHIIVRDERDEVKEKMKIASQMKIHKVEKGLPDYFLGKSPPQRRTTRQTGKFDLHFKSTYLSNPFIICYRQKQRRSV